MTMSLAVDFNGDRGDEIAFRNAAGQWQILSFDGSFDPNESCYEVFATDMISNPDNCTHLISHGNIPRKLSEFCILHSALPHPKVWLFNRI